MLQGAVPFLALLVSTHQTSVITKPKQPPYFQRPHQGHKCLLLGQLKQERQSLQGYLPEALMMVVEWVDSQLGDHQYPKSPKQAQRSVLDSHQDQIIPPQQKGPWE